MPSFTSTPSPLSSSLSSSSFTPSSSEKIQSSLSPSNYFSSLIRRRQHKKMSITQTYYLAHTARRKLTREASRADHDLRLLVGHANLLDSLMLELADAEHEQERWFNQTVHGAAKAQDEVPRHIQWAETVIEEPEEEALEFEDDLSDVDSLSDDSDYDEDEFAINTPMVRRRAPSPVAIITEKELEEDYDSDSDDSDFEYDDAEDLQELTLTRSPSRQTPPELSSDSEEESEDEAMPPSPPQPTLETFSEKQAQSTEIPLGSEQPSLFDEYYVPEQGPIIEAY